MPGQRVTLSLPCADVPDAFGSPLFHQGDPGYSRLLVDLNRSLEDPSAIPEVSDNVPVPGNQGLSREQKALRVRSFYTPYREAIDSMLYRHWER
ncbi:MAG: hypothetical protein GY703_09825 [Gammaproteobacteria bacterium]|nr:hypothetical protein [Gammaproteobacteria bacterium]